MYKLILQFGENKKIGPFDDFKKKNGESMTAQIVWNKKDKKPELKFSKKTQ